MTTLSEAASRAVVAGAGVRVSAWAEARSADEAVAVASDLGLPVVAKLCGDAIAHKTERGLVRLGLASEDEVAVATTELLAAARPEDGEVSVLISTMVAGNRELIAGLIRDEQFGPCVMLGVGGVLAEAVADLRVALGQPGRPFVAALAGSIRMGAPIGPALDAASAELRADSRRRAEIRARKVPVRMLFPLALCILPAFVLLSVAPMVLDALDDLQLDL